MLQERVSFLSNNLTCRGVLFLPDNWVRPLRIPTIVIMPGSSGYKTPSRELSNKGDWDCGYGLIEMAKMFCQAGFGACVYNGRGQGDSEGTRSSQRETIEDALSAIEFLLAEVDSIDPTRIGVFGPSIGGAAALYVASQKPAIRSVVVWGTPPSWTKAREDGRLEHSVEKLWKKRDADKPPLEEFSKQFETVDPVKWLEDIHQPVLITGGSEDRSPKDGYFLDEEQDELIKGLHNAAQVIYLRINGFHHRLLHMNPLFTSYVQILIGWYRATL